MNLMDLFIKIGVDDQATSKISKITSSVGNGLKTAAKVGTAALGVAAAGITALTTASIKQFAEYEQLVGGAELMFGKAFETVKKNAQDAYKTVQMSQNEYLKQVNGFATGLKTALGGNEQAAAELSHKIVQAEADIIAATGNTAENVQNAFNGIMRSNFTMLDNLQIGITPTKEGFQEVIDKVNEWNASMGKMTEYQMGNLADMQSALVDYIEMVGMSGYAQMEASKTISGSLASTKSAWSNLVVGIADENAKFGKLINNFVESVATTLDNILPRVEEALHGVAALIYKTFPIIMERIPKIISDFLPRLAENAVMIVQSVVEGISQNQEMLAETAFGLITYLAESILNMLPTIIETGLQLLVSLAYGIAENLPTLIPTIIDVIMQIVNILTAPEQLQMILNAALTLITKLAMGLINAIPSLVDACVTIIENIVLFLTDPENIGKLLLAAVQIVLGLATGIIKSIPRLLELFIELPKKIIKALFETDWGQIGKDIINGIWNGLKQMWTSLTSWFSDAWDSLVGGVKDLLGIHSPSRVFADIGKNMALGVGVGWNKNFARIKGDINKSLDFDDVSLGVSTYRQSDVFGESIRGGVSVIQNIYSEAKTAADLMEEATYRLQIAEMGAS